MSDDTRVWRARDHGEDADEYADLDQDEELVDDRPPVIWTAQEPGPLEHAVAAEAVRLAAALRPDMNELDATAFQLLGAAWSREPIELACVHVLDEIGVRVVGTARWEGAPALLVAEVNAVDDCETLEEVLEARGPSLRVVPGAGPEELQAVLLGDPCGRTLPERKSTVPGVLAEARKEGP